VKKGLIKLCGALCFLAALFALLWFDIIVRAGTAARTMLSYPAWLALVLFLALFAAWFMALGVFLLRKGHRPRAKKKKEVPGRMAKLEAEWPYERLRDIAAVMGSLDADECYRTALHIADTEDGLAGRGVSSKMRDRPTRCWLALIDTLINQGCVIGVDWKEALEDILWSVTRLAGRHGFTVTLGPDDDCYFPDKTDRCLTGLADKVEQQGLALGNIYSGGDEYNLFIIHKEQRDVLKQLAGQYLVCETGGAGLELDDIGLTFEFGW
jgi:hypothetical protein